MPFVALEPFKVDVILGYLQFNFQFLRHPVVIDEPLECNHQNLGESVESLGLHAGGFGVTLGTEEVGDVLFSEKFIQTSFKIDRSTLFYVRVNRSYQGQLTSLGASILDSSTLLALNSTFKFKLKSLARVWVPILFLKSLNLLHKIVEILSSVLLLVGLKLRVSLANQRLKHVWFDPILHVINPLFLFFALALVLNFLGNFFLRVSAAEDSINKL